MFVCAAKLPPNPLGTTPKRFTKARGESCRYPTAASMLAAYGSLDGEAATIHHPYEHALQQRRRPGYYRLHGVSRRIVEESGVGHGRDGGSGLVGICTTGWYAWKAPVTCKKGPAL